MDQSYQVDYHSGGQVAVWAGGGDWQQDPATWWDTLFTFAAFAAYGAVVAACFVGPR